MANDQPSPKLKKPKQRYNLEERIAVFTKIII